MLDIFDKVIINQPRAVFNSMLRKPVPEKPVPGAYFPRKTCTGTPNCTEKPVPGQKNLYRENLYRDSISQKNTGRYPPVEDRSGI